MSGPAPSMDERLDDLEAAVSGMAEALGTLAEAVAEMQRKRTVEDGMRDFRARIAARAAGRVE